MVSKVDTQVVDCPVQAASWMQELASEVPLFAVDLHQRITHWAPSCEPVLGPSEGVLGRLCYEVMGPRTRQCRANCAVVTNARAGNATRPFTMWLDGEQRSTLTTILHRDESRPAILHVFQPGAATFDESVSESDSSPAPAAAIRLTERQVQVLRLLAEGEAPRNIADQLGLRPITVRNHLQSAIERLGAHNRLEAVLFAHRSGLL